LTDDGRFIPPPVGRLPIIVCLPFTPYNFCCRQMSDPSPSEDNARAENVEDVSFEDALERLESIVETLEEDPPALDESLDAYEEGVSLAKSCLERLNEAEQRINELDVDE
jgi:exodeoxyribonuclease VII small subunit